MTSLDPAFRIASSASHSEFPLYLSMTYNLPLSSSSSIMQKMIILNNRVDILQPYLIPHVNSIVSFSFPKFIIILSAAYICTINSITFGLTLYFINTFINSVLSTESTCTFSLLYSNHIVSAMASNTSIDDNQCVLSHYCTVIILFQRWLELLLLMTIDVYFLIIVAAMVRSTMAIYFLKGHR